MPTPESAAFLAKKPTVPPTYEGVDFEDNVALHNARDAIIREQWVRSMMSRLVGEELGKCYAREGVNHLEKCGKLRANGLRLQSAEKYFELLKERKVKGYLFQEKNYFAGEGEKSA
ncbi:NADH-ubiquinone oxidoreductase 12 kDa subunit, mitochondrial [Aspergillus lentulus]|uniref:NADH-ubiquinone oxidoreductase 12 kDa subunit, mitochondrial n=1 Tax=Aspergillus lentulus TaxID=293939 RepID=A0AAN4PHC7_ASPLE|nr:NADH-ubiquinone oxidoreductase 12 kDa subunit, mitochondrial [Aspergillus lentulus]